jgi:hypothetical protein
LVFALLKDRNVTGDANALAEALAGKNSEDNSTPDVLTRGMSQCLEKLLDCNAAGYVGVTSLGQGSFKGVCAPKICLASTVFSVIIVNKSN